MKASLLNGLPVESFDRLALFQKEKICHLTRSLTQRPKWASDFSKLYDIKIIDKLYEEVLSHEATFHGYQEDQGESEERS